MFARRKSTRMSAGDVQEKLELHSECGEKSILEKARVRKTPQPDSENPQPASENARQTFEHVRLGYYILHAPFPGSARTNQNFLKFLSLEGLQTYREELKPYEALLPTNPPNPKTLENIKNPKP